MYSLKANDSGGDDSKKQSPTIWEHSPDETNTRCGFSKFKPRCLQVFNKPTVLLLLLCIFSFIQGFVVNGVNNANTSTYERRFEMSGSRVGVISSAYDASAAVFGIVVSYFGSGKNKSKWLSVGALVMAFGSVTMSLPHFIIDNYKWIESDSDVCPVDSDSSTCIPGSGFQNYLYVLILGQLLHGFGGTILFTIGCALIDDSVPSRSFPFYLAFVFIFNIVGPSFGFLLSGETLQMYVDFDRVNTSSLPITPENPRWAGAWWLGFLCGAAMAVLIVIPLAAFGQELPTARRVKETRVSETHDYPITQRASETHFGKSIKDLPAATLIVLKNIPFVCMCFAGAAFGMSLFGFMTFIAKYMENQFGMSAARSSKLIGAMLIPSSVIGILGGGYICKRFELGVRGMLKLMMICLVLTTVSQAFLWAVCDRSPTAGVTVMYTNRSTQIQLNAECNADCGCSTEFYDPVCGENGIKYFSPCYAGCRGSVNKNKTFTNCSCLREFTETGNSQPIEYCSEDCDLFYVFMVMAFLVMCITLVPGTAADTILLRCIPDGQRTYCLGWKWLIVRVIGTIPGPIVYGALFDDVCLVWGHKCGERTSCWIYDSSGLVLNVFLIMVSLKLISLLFVILAYKFYKPPTITSDKSPTADCHKAIFSVDTPATEMYHF